MKDDKDFLGREALLEASPRKRLCCITLEDPRSVALGNEPVRVDGEIAGRVTTGGYGYTVERSIAYAYLPPEQAEPGTAVEIDIFGSWVGGEVDERAAVRPGRRAGTRLRVSRPYDEAYDERGAPRPHYAAAAGRPRRSRRGRGPR